MGEVENIGPGLTRQLIVSLPEAATYQLACKPGMVGTGIRQDFVVTGDSQAATDESGQLAEAADGYRRYIRSQIVALQDTAAQFVAAVQSGNVDQAKALFRSHVPTTSASNPKPRASANSIPSWTCAKRIWSPVRSGRDSTASRRICG